MSDNNDTHLMLDCGAYSTWKKGWPETDPKLYSDHIDKYRTSYWRYVNVDVIPGEPGRIGSTEEVEQAAARGFENYKYMSAERGLDPMPVHHQGESWHWLRRYLDAGVKVIGLSTTTNSGKDAQCH